MPEEGRYVSVAWEMLRSGNWLVPTENGLPFFHKPPLFYWLTAVSLHVFGTGAAAARLTPLLGALTGAAALYRFTSRCIGDRTARLMAAVLLTTPFFFGGAQVANLDMLVAGFIALATSLGAEAVLRLRRGEAHRAVLASAWAAAALGVLAKGLIGIVLPALVLVVWLATTGQARALLRLLTPLGAGVFALIALPWFIAVQVQYPGFAHYFFVYQHLERFAAGGFNNVQPWWFFVAAVPLLSLPWSLWLVVARYRAAAGEAAEAVLWRRLMWTWLGVVVLFFSIPASKPVGYAMPVLFPLAALIADAIAARGTGGFGGIGARTAAAIGAASLTCVAVLAGSVLMRHTDDTAIGRELLRLRAADDPVLFVGEYFSDVTLHARLPWPVPVTGDWHDPAIAGRDNWRRELAEAAPFAPDLAARLLVDDSHGLALRCGTRPLWVVARRDNAGRVESAPGALPMLTANGVTLWRIAAATCETTASPIPPA